MSSLLLLLATLVACTLATPLLPAAESSLDLVAVPVEELPSFSPAVLRVKRQFGGGGGRRHRPGPGGFGGGGRYGGGYPQGGGFGGGFPQQGGFQQPSFSSSAANAQAQGFNAGNFGASSAGAGTQSFGFGPGGFQGSAGQSFSQNYKFPGLDINVAGAETFGVGPGGVTRGGSSGITVNGQPFQG